jgi:dihydroorotase
LLEIGRDADLIVVDMKNGKNIRAEELHSKCGWTPYENFEAIFPRAVFLGGNMIVEDGNLMDERLGKYVG